MAKQKKSKGKKIALIIIAIILVLCLGVAATGITFYIKAKNAEPLVEDTLTYDFDEDETVAQVLADDPEFDKIFEGDSTELRAKIKEWATNGGDIMYSDNVINVLCVGVDTRNKNTISGLTDSMILVSVNRKNETITFTSIMRDSYAYLESPEGNGSFNKINSAFPFYGIDSLINTIETHFKVRIDGYAMINFAFFKAVIDKLGGVNVPVQQYEANYVNKVGGFSISAGDSVNLNGDEALVFCRSRKCDSDGDISRTRRQRQVLTGLLKKAGEIKASELPDYVTTFMPYLETSYTEADVLSLGSKAIIGGWAGFSVQQLVMPDEASRKAHSGSTWYWEVDYPLAAKTLQETIYGESNIVLSEDR